MIDVFFMFLYIVGIGVILGGIGILIQTGVEKSGRAREAVKSINGICWFLIIVSVVRMVSGNHSDWIERLVFFGAIIFVGYYKLCQKDFDAKKGKQEDSQ